MTPVWQCEHCGGPAIWTHVEGEVLYLCELQCDGFMQSELFEETRVPSVMREGRALRQDRLTPIKEIPLTAGDPHGT